MPEPLSASPLQAQTKGQVKQLRSAGRVPISVYHRGEEPLHLQTEAKPLDEFIRQHGEAVLLPISIDGATHSTQVHQVQRDPISKRLLHVSLQRVASGDTVKARVPLVFHGEPDSVKDHTAVVQHAVEQLEVRCDSGSLPDHITVDISQLAFGDSIRVADLPAIAGVEILLPRDTVLASLSSLLKSGDAIPEAPAVVETADAATDGFAASPGSPHETTEPAAE